MTKPKAAKAPRQSALERSRPKVTAETSILGHAMLANVRISIWEGRKHDREVTSRVNEEYAASPEAGRYHKQVFGGKVKELSAVVAAAIRLRALHHSQTLPWEDTGWRLLPTENYFTYTQIMRAAIADYNAAADAWAAVYDRSVKEAEAKLKGMFKASDYPSALAVRNKYRVELEFSPLPAGEDFRVQLPAAEISRIAQEAEDRITRSVASAMEEAWGRLGDVVTRLRDKLDDGKYLRDGLLEKVREVAEVLGRLNVTKDEALEKARSRVLAELAVYDADTLKKDANARTKAATAADSILKQMQGLYSPRKEDEA